MKHTVVTLVALLALAAGLVTAQEDSGPKVWVHAPAEDLLALFPEKGAGFLISLEEYQRLLEAARKRQAEERDQPPLGARLIRGTVAGRIEEDVARLEASYIAVVKSDRPAEIAFPLENIALEQVHVEGGSLRLHSIPRLCRWRRL